MFTYRPESTRRLVDKRPALQNNSSLPPVASAVAKSLSPNDVLSEYGLVPPQPSKMARRESSQPRNRAISGGVGGYGVKVEASSNVENHTNVFSALSPRQALGNFGNLSVNSPPLPPQPPDGGWLSPGTPAAAVSPPQTGNPGQMFSNPNTSPFNSPAYPTQSWGQTTYFSLRGPVQQQQQQQQQQQYQHPILYQQPQQQQQHLHQQQQLHHQNQQFNVLPPISQMVTGIRGSSSSSSYQQGDMNLQIPKTVEDWSDSDHNLIQVHNWWDDCLDD